MIQTIGCKGIVTTIGLLFLFIGNGAVAEDSLVAAAEKFAETAIKHGRDTYGKDHTPVFVDVLNVDTLRPPNHGNGLEGTVSSNFAYQQNLMRLLVGLSKFTGDTKYRDEAKKAVRHMFDHYSHKGSGLFYWGVHCSIDVNGGTVKNPGGPVHEIKGVYPYYDLMYEVDPERTERFVKGFWAAHIKNWSDVFNDRHGVYRAINDLDNVWNWQKEWNDPPYWYNGKGGAPLLNASSDLIYAAIFLGRKKQDEKASLWGQRLFGQYAKGRNKVTRIMPSGGFAYPRHTALAKRWFPAAKDPQGNFYMGQWPYSCIGRDNFGLLRAAEHLAKAGDHEGSKEMVNKLSEHLVAYARYAYVPEKNELTPILADGTDLSGYKMRHDGGPMTVYKNTILTAKPATTMFLPTYALAYRLSRNQALWKTLRDMCRGNGLGDIGEKTGAKPQLDTSCKSSEPYVVFALVELYKATDENAYLKFAEHICRNIIRQRHHPKSGLFTLDKDHLACHLDCYEPMAFLTVAAAKENKLDLIPLWEHGGVYEWQENRIISGYAKRWIKECPQLADRVLRRSHKQE